MNVYPNGRKRQTRPLRLIYCRRACERDWTRRDRRANHTWRREGLRYAERNPEGVWTCLCCGARVLVVWPS